ncbi:MAG: GntR family transcriptional regulator [Hyphomicrobiaceae bacterium]|uniref:GntR family transcriptional regulator n=1 Tax=Hoeflea sp. AS60 TaxID=3135780 RepID=UPI001E14DE5F|nr:GntR family transcriptional regulator [Hyphomicrobiaceae bacterium]
MTDQTKTLHSDFIASELEREIIAHMWPAGSKLDENALAQRFGVSRTPVREALHVVVSRSLAKREPYRGVVVADVSRDRIDQMFEAMSEIEAICGRFAAARMTMTERTELEAVHNRMQNVAQQRDFPSYDRINTEFHSLIFAGTHNEDLVETANAMRLKLAPFRSSQLQQAERVAKSNEEHTQIVMAILDRNSKDAERALRRHLQSAAKAVLQARSAKR